MYLVTCNNTMNTSSHFIFIKCIGNNGEVVPFVFKFS